MASPNEGWGSNPAQSTSLSKNTLVPRRAGISYNMVYHNYVVVFHICLNTQYGIQTVE